MSQPASQPLSVAVIGGGIGGLCLVIGLLQQPNIKVTVYEAAAAFEEIGAGLTLGPNARRALNLLDLGAEQAYLSQTTGNGPSFPELRNVYCRYVFGAGERSGQFIADAWCEDGQQSVHRAKFLEELIKLVPADVARFRKRLCRDGITDDGEKVQLRFEDGSVEEADCVIGADGIHSVVRKHLVAEGQLGYHPSFAQVIAYRGLIPIEEARAALGEELAQVATLQALPGGLIMTYPVDFHKLFNIVACIFDVPTWEGPTVQPADIAKMKSQFAPFGPTSRKVADLLDRPETKIWSLWQMPSLSTFVKGRVALLGDAAHATVPFHGQGGAQAIEDTLVLSNLLGRVAGSDDLECALRAYDRIRRPRSQKVVRSSREAGELFALKLPGVWDDAEAFRDNVQDRYDWMFNRDMQLQVDQACIMMDEIRDEKSRKHAGAQLPNGR